MKTQRSIRFWLLALVVAAILPITVFAAIVAERLAEAERQALIGEVRQRTESLAHGIERQLETSYTALSALAESVELRNDDFTGLHALARRLLSRQAIGTTIGLVGRDGRFILNTRFAFGESLPPVSGDDISRQVFATGRPQASDLFLGTVTLDLLVTLDVPVFRDDQVIYDLRIGIRPDTLAAVLAEQALPEGWYAVVVDRKGRYIARSHAPDRVGEQASAELRSRMAVDDEGIYDGFTVTGIPVKASFRKMRSTGWTAVIGVPQTLLAAPTQRSLMLVGAGGLGLLLIGGTGAFLLARRLSRQIAQATAASAALGEGTAPPPIATEVRELAELRNALGQAHRLLAQREERLTLAHDAAQAAPWEYDAETEHLVWSPESARLYGFDPEHPPRTIAGWLDLVVDEDRPAFEAEIRRPPFAYPSIIRTEFRIRHPQTGLRWLVVVARAVHGADAALLRLVGLSVDITERKNAEEALRESKERLTFAMEAANAGWWDWDLRNGTAEWSHQLRRLLGYDASVMPSVDAWSAKIHPEDRAAALETVAASLAGRVANYRSEYRIARGDAGYCWLLAVGKTTCSSDGRPLRMVGLSIDVTQLKMAEQAMFKAKREAEQANLAKTRFLAAASHDLRQPVQSLMLFTTFLTEQLQGREVCKAVGHVEKAVLALKTLLDGILDISRLDAGIVSPQPTETPAARLLDQLASEYRLVASQKGLELRFVPTTACLRTDPLLLERILRNFLDNAMKYTQAGRILMGCRRRGETLRIEVWDTGVGIDEDQLQAIFLEFHQLNNPERDRAKGLGLGLAIVDRLARLMDHRIFVRSRPGRGSCFSVAVPLHATEPRSAAAPIAATTERLAVIIDDDEEICAGLRMLLETWGYQVVAGADDAEVMPELASRRPDLVFADYRLRGGLTGIRMLRAITEAVGHPVRGVVLTGDTAPESVVEARAYGYEVLYKPVTAAALRAFLPEPE